jgi:hypothetical protein
MVANMMVKARNAEQFDPLNELRGPLPDDLDAKLEVLIPTLHPRVLIAVLKNGSESANARGAMARGVLFIPKNVFGDFAREITDALRTMLEDPNPGLQIAALDTLSGLHATDAATIEAITKLTADRSAIVSRNAKHRLVELNG